MKKNMLAAAAARLSQHHLVRGETLRRATLTHALQLHRHSKLHVGWRIIAASAHRHQRGILRHRIIDVNSRPRAAVAAKSGISLAPHCTAA